MKNIKKFILYGTVLFALPVYGQQQPSVKRHPGQHLHYKVTLADGDINKITNVSVALRLTTPPPANQPNAQRQFGNNCGKSADPKVWDCDVTIPEGIADGDYQLLHVAFGTTEFGAQLDQDFHVPIVPIENPNTFTPPSKVTVTEQP